MAQREIDSQIELTPLGPTGIEPPMEGVAQPRLVEPVSGVTTEVKTQRRLARLGRLGLPVIFSGLILLIVVVVALLADLIAPLDPSQLTFLTKLKPPFWLPRSDPRFWLGTDAAGHDILKYLIHGARTSLIVGLLAPTLAAIVGVAMGLLAGFGGKWADTIIMRMVDIQIAFPSLILTLVLIAVLKPSMFSLILVLTIASWAIFARVSRGEVLSIRNRDFVTAARAVGASSVRIALRHVLPNIFSTVLVYWTSLVGVVILAEAALSFLGLGLPAPAISWGGMLSDARNYLGSAWWIPFWPGLTLTLVIISINTLGDWLRDVLDPTTRR